MSYCQAEQEPCLNWQKSGNLKKRLSKEKQTDYIAGEFWKPLVNLIATDDPDSSRYIEVAAGPDEVKNLDFARQVRYSGGN